MLTDVDLEKIRAIVREEIRTAGYRPMITCTPYLDTEDDTRARIELLSEIDRRNDERIAAWQAAKEAEKP